MELFYRLIEFSHGKNSLQEQEEKAGNEITEVLSKNFILAQLKNQYANFIYEKCLMSYVKAQCYKPTKIKRNNYEVRSYDSSNQKIYFVILEEKKLTCSCWFSKQWGVPCLHILVVANSSPDKFLSALQFKERWMKKDVITSDEKFIEHLKEKIGKQENTSGKSFIYFIIY